MHSISASKPYTGKLPYFCRQFPGRPFGPSKIFASKKAEARPLWGMPILCLVIFYACSHAFCAAISTAARLAVKFKPPCR